MKWTVTLPWLRPPLTSNDRGISDGARRARWATIARVRADTCLLVRHAKIPPCKSITVQLHYQPATKRSRDATNLAPTEKPCLDGIVDARVVPDDTPEYLTLLPTVLHPAVPNGSVLWLEIEGTPV